MMCIYKIEIKRTKYIYIGSTNKMSRRKNQHLRELKKGIHVNKILQNIFNKYKEESLKFSILEKVEDKNILLDREKKYIDLFISSEEWTLVNIYTNPFSPAGEQHGRAKLTWKQVREIRQKLKDHIPRKDLAKEYGMSLGTIKQIKSNDIWIEEGYSHEKTENVKLNLSIANKIREDWINNSSITGRALAKKYCISSTVIYLTLQNKIWKDAKYGDLSTSGWQKIV